MTGTMALLVANTADVVTLVGGTISDEVTSPTTCDVEYQLTNGGLEKYALTSGGFVTLGSWVIPTANAGNYEVRATLNSGSLTSGTTGSWLALSTTRTWVRQRIAIGSSSANLTIEVRRASDGLVMASKTVDLTASVTP